MNEVISMLEDEPTFFTENVCIEPPEVSIDTNEDSGPEDCGGVAANLTGRQLHARAQATVVSANCAKQTVGAESSDHSDAEGEDMQDDQQDNVGKVKCRRRKLTSKEPVKIRKWVKEDTTAEKSMQSSVKPAFLERDMSACSMFELFFDEDVTEHIVCMPKLHAQQEGKSNFDISCAQLRCFFSILLVSGYVPLPRRRMFWEQSAMSVNRLEKIMRQLHLSNNLKLPPTDKMGKVRRLLTMLNERFRLFWPVEDELSIDESMVPYYGRHSAKQFLRGKPIRFGYKLWCLNTRLGYLNLIQSDSDPYQGASATYDANLGNVCILHRAKVSFSNDGTVTLF